MDDMEYHIKILQKVYKSYDYMIRIMDWSVVYLRITFFKGSSSEVAKKGASDSNWT